MSSVRSSIRQTVKSPKEISEQITSEAQTPNTPPYQCLMRNLEIYSPVTGASARSLTFTPKSADGAISMAETIEGQASESIPKPSIEPNIFLPHNTPLLDHHEGSPFMHHRGSPFKTFSPLFKGSSLQNTPSKTNLNYPLSTPPRYMPLKVVGHNDNAKPYDPSIEGHSIKSSPLVKSLDYSASDSPPAIGMEMSNLEMSTPKVKAHDEGHPPLPNFKLTPRTTPRRNHGGHPPLPVIRLTPRSTPRKRYLEDELHPMMDTDTHRRELTPKCHRKVSVDELSNTSRGSRMTPTSSDASMTSADPMISMILSVENGTHVQEMKHFPKTLKMEMKHSRSLLNPNSRFDSSIQKLLRADAMVEMARANNESLTDNEDSDLDCDPDYVLCSPPSLGSKRSSAQGKSSKLNKKLSYLPMPNLKRDASSTSSSLIGIDRATSSTSLLGIKHLQDIKEHDSNARRMSHSESSDRGQFTCISRATSGCSLALSVDSVPGDSKRELFTPPPIMKGSNNGFHALSPPPLGPNHPQW